MGVGENCLVAEFMGHKDAVILLPLDIFAWPAERRHVGMPSNFGALEPVQSISVSALIRAKHLIMSEVSNQLIQNYILTHHGSNEYFQFILGTNLQGGKGWLYQRQRIIPVWFAFPAGAVC